MIVLVETRGTIGHAYRAGFERAGVTCIIMEPAAFLEWLGASSASERAAVEGVVVGDVDERPAIGQACVQKISVPLIALTDQRALKQTLALFEAGFDDVIGKPVHVQEILARVVRIVGRGASAAASHPVEDEIMVFSDGRDPVVRGEVLILPRRERRILECLFQSRTAWLTKSQIFNRVYGVFNDQYDESVIESHICRLRRRMKVVLGYDPIESQRYLGYRLTARRPSISVSSVARLAQCTSSILPANLVLADGG